MKVLHSIPSLLGLVCGLALVLPGCDHEDTLDPDLELVEPGLDTSLRSGGDWGCRTCGYTNSPFFGQLPIDRFIVEGGPLGAKLKLSALQDPAGQRYPAQVDEQGFVAVGPAGPVQGGALVGWTLVLTREGEEQLVGITAFEQHPDWVDGDLVSTFGLAYHDPEDPDAPVVNVCPGLSPDETSVVLLTDELYDMTSKTVKANQPGWVTMACRGHALAKLKLLGYDPHDAYQSTAEQRQAAIKAITADYCGGGTSFTAVGQPLEWADELGNFRVSDLSPSAAVEARWSEQGALCLNEPRLVPRGDVEALCSLPWCDEGTDLDGARWLTAVPKSP